MLSPDWPATRLFGGFLRFGFYPPKNRTAFKSFFSLFRSFAISPFLPYPAYRPPKLPFCSVAFLLLPCAPGGLYCEPFPWMP